MAFSLCDQGTRKKRLLAQKQPKNLKHPKVPGGLETPEKGLLKKPNKNPKILNLK
jgi:hypothetical protein